MKGCRLPWYGWHLLAIVLVGIATYGGSLGNAFQYDDLHSIVGNPHLRTLRNIPEFFWRPELFSADPRNAMYRPLVLVSYALNYAVSGDEVWSYHLVNLAVHLALSCLLYAVVRRLGGGGLEALFAGLFLVLHPLASEPVNYISSRSESLCALGFMLAFWCYLHPGRWWGGGSAAAFGGALMAKSVALALPLVLLVFEASRGRSGRHWPGILKRQSVLWVVGAVYVLGIRSAIDTAMVAHPVRSLGVQLLTQIKAGVYYLWLLWLPQRSSVEHQFLLAGGLAGPVVWALLFLAAMVLLLLVWARPEAVFWVGWIALTLLPSSLVPLNVLVNEHRLYLALVAFSALAGKVAATVVSTRGRVGLALVVVWFSVLGGLAWRNTEIWRTPESLWQNALRLGPHMPRPHLFLADCYQQSGRYEEALREYRLTRTVYPQMLSAGDLLISYNNEGAAYLALGRHNEAIEAYRQALNVDPTYERSRVSLDALVALQERQWDPGAHALHRRGLALLVANQPGDAVPVLEESLVRQVRLETYLALAMACERNGEWAKARRAYASLRTLAPGSDFARTADEKLTQLEEK